MDPDSRTTLEAATFRRLVAHLQEHTDVQNIDLMIVADFCRNCLAKWYLAAAQENSIPMEYADALEAIYGMPYAQWKARYQREATPEQLAAYEEVQRRKAEKASPQEP